MRTVEQVSTPAVSGQDMTDSDSSKIDSLKQEHDILRKLFHGMNGRLKAVESMFERSHVEKRQFEDAFRKQLENAVSKLAELSEQQHDEWRKKTLSWHQQVEEHFTESLEHMRGQVRNSEEVATRDLNEIKKHVQREMKDAQCTYERIQASLAISVNDMETRFEQFEHEVQNVHAVLDDVRSRQHHMTKVASMREKTTSFHDGQGLSRLGGMVAPCSSEEHHPVTQALLSARAEQHLMQGARRRSDSENIGLQRRVQLAQDIAESVRGRTETSRITAAQRVASSRSNSVSSNQRHP